MLPNNTKEEIDQYVSRGVPPGGFLAAVLANDLFAAVTSAGEDNLPNLESVCRYVQDSTPPGCHGSHARVSGWLLCFTSNENDLNDVPVNER